MRFIDTIGQRIKKAGLSGGDFFAALVLSFIIASIVYALKWKFTLLLYVRQYPLWIPILILGLCFALVVALSLLLKTKRLIAWLLMLSAMTFSVILVCALPANVFFCMGLSFVILLCTKYCTEDDKLGLDALKINDKLSFGIVALLCVAFTATVYILTAAKYRSFYHSAFDFGIFCQMFESMADTGIPYTTVERGELMSHFGIHFSPFFYLLLPGYMVFRSPLYLLFMQALAVSLGAFAVRRICRALDLSPGESACGAAIYLLFPTMGNGCFYDFHENKFLSVLILWALALILEKKPVGAGIFLFLILTVKEDAFIYVIAICLWMLVTKRNRAFAVCATVFSLLWFFFACSMIELSGGEIMSDRFKNYSANANPTLWDAVRTCFINVGYLFKEVFAGADMERFKEMTYSGQKMEFIWWTATPLLFTPFLRKRSSELVLLIPLLVINMMQSWMYQHDIDFQYTYGSCALLIFSALLFLGESRHKVRRFALIGMLCLSIIFSSSVFLPKAKRFTDSYYQNKEMYDATAAVLETIPKDASVTAYGYMTPHLWYIKDLQTSPRYYGKLVRTDYFVIDTRFEDSASSEAMFDIMKDDYELFACEGYAAVYKLKD
ncbi:MAG: DUF2079 domain-containing protein [Clostridia bacterium]|nr:DUF2079 domain-containing protein [Clostridia bacterium]